MKLSSSNINSSPFGVSTVLCGVTCIAMAITLYMVFFYAPTEKTMGVVQHILYVHLPSAGVTFLAFFFVMLASIGYLITTRRKWDIIAHASAEIGTLFCALVLISGCLWAKPVWNVWWLWDLRVTTTFVLGLMYVVYLMLRKAVKGEVGARCAGVFGIIAFFTVPLVYVSIRWWRTIHPTPVIMGGSGSGLEPRIALTLLASMITFTALFFYLLQHRVAIDRMEDDLEAIRRTVAAQEQSMRDFLIENEDFIIEDYTFKEYKKHE